jgi:2,5-furandicarboxylate decarboxylase 1
MEAFRQYLQQLEDNEHLQRFASPLSIRFETAAVMQSLEKEQGPAALFTNIPPFDTWSLAGNLYTSLNRLAFGLNLHVGAPFKAALIKRCSQASSAYSPVQAPTRETTSAPFQENIHSNTIDLPALIPVPMHCALDSGPFITAGIVIAKDPLTEESSMQVIMVEVKEGNRLLISPVTPPLDAFFRQAEEINKPLEVAIVIGAEPALMFAACAPPLLSKGDKLALAAALRGSPIPFVTCETVDIAVPAGAELVLEGTIIPHEREKMGPWGNYLRTYSRGVDKPVMEVRSVKHRTHPVYQDILATGKETVALMAIPTEISVYQELSASFSNVQDVHITTESSGLQTIISLRQNDAPNAREISEYVLTRFLIKSCILVDIDIDIYDPADVAWAVATRVQARKDFIVLPEMPALPLDPSAPEGNTDKWSIDATCESPESPGFRKADLPPQVRDKFASS